MLGAGNTAENKTDMDSIITGTCWELDIKLIVIDVYINCEECYEGKVQNALRKLVGSLV